MPACYIQYEALACASTAGSCSFTWISKEAKCTLRIVRHFLLFCSLL